MAQIYALIERGRNVEEKRREEKLIEKPKGVVTLFKEKDGILYLNLAII